MKTYSVPIRATFADEIILAVDDNATQEEIAKKAIEFFSEAYTIYTEQDEEGNYPFSFDSVELAGTPKLEGQN